jgi:hypothetical protein
MPIKTRKIRKGKMKGGWPKGRWPWSKPARVAPAPLLPPPPPPEPPSIVDKFNRSYEKYTDDILYFNGVLNDKIEDIQFYMFSLRISACVYGLQIALIYEIWNLTFLKDEIKESLKEKLKGSLKRRKFYNELRKFIKAFEAKMGNEDAKREYDKIYNEDNFFDKFQKNTVLRIRVFETFDERTYTGNLYINMKRLEEMYEYCHNIETMMFLIKKREFFINKASFLHYGSEIPGYESELFKELMVYTSPAGTANLSRRIEVAKEKSKSPQYNYDPNRKIGEEEVSVRKLWEETLMRVVSNAVKRAGHFLLDEKYDDEEGATFFKGNPSDEEIEELHEAYKMREEVKEVQAAGVAAEKAVVMAAAAARLVRKAKNAVEEAATKEGTEAAVGAEVAAASREARAAERRAALVEERTAKWLARAAEIGREVLEAAAARRAARAAAAAPPRQEAWGNSGNGNNGSGNGNNGSGNGNNGPGNGNNRPGNGNNGSGNGNKKPRNGNQGGGDLTKPVQTTTVPKVVVTGQTLW